MAREAPVRRSGRAAPISRRTAIDRRVPLRCRPISRSFAQDHHGVAAEERAVLIPGDPVDVRLARAGVPVGGMEPDLLPVTGHPVVVADEAGASWIRDRTQVGNRRSLRRRCGQADVLRFDTELARVTSLTPDQTCRQPPRSAIAQTYVWPRVSPSLVPHPQPAIALLA